ncbi:DUF481 domain-containing protein [Poriferisphaera sp. WC338]|uniref:DUF481 domain-containing protein n=1 Tax=Poriferisphaera sp. WC338 TaxID=3425129 RepID=UPI003D81644F
MKFGNICLAASLALCISTATNAASVQLSNGDTINGEVLEVTEEHIVINHPVIGQVRILKTQVTNLDAVLNPDAPTEPASEAKPEPVAEPTPPEEPVVEDVIPGVLGTNFLRGWEKSLQAGVSGSAGNSETTDINIGANAKFENDLKRWDFSSALFYSEADGKETKNQAYAQLVRDWKFIDSPWFIFAQGRYDYDNFQAYEHRVSPSGGLGYQFYDTDDFKLRSTFGAGFAYNFGDVDKKFVPEANMGISGEWNINDHNSLTAGSQYFPSFEDPMSIYRIVSNAEWKIKMDSARGLSLKLGLLHEYNSQTDGTDTNNNDLQYYAALVLDF